MNDAQIVYVDTSAAVSLLIDQPSSAALVAWLDSTRCSLVSSDLLETELRRVAVREGLDQSLATRLLEGVDLAPLDRAVFRSTGFLPMPFLRSLDALHLEAAIRLNADALLTYDRRLGDAAREIGIDVLSPGLHAT